MSQLLSYLLTCRPVTKSGWCTRQVILALFGMVTKYSFILVGGHALASPKGGRPCPLGTLKYEVTGHLAIRFNLMTQKDSGDRYQSTTKPECLYPGWLQHDKE